MFMFYCRHPFNHGFSVFLCVIVMDKSKFCTFSRTFRPDFGLLLKLAATKNRKSRIKKIKNGKKIFCESKYRYFV